MTQDSEIVYHKSGGITLAGPDAVNLYRAAHIKAGLALYARSKMLMTRGATPSFLLATATQYTGHKYKRGAYLEAAKDLGDWIETMKAALPVTDERVPNVGEEA